MGTTKPADITEQEPEVGTPGPASEVIEISAACPGCETIIHEKIKFCGSCGFYLGELFFKQPTKNPIRIVSWIQDRFYDLDSVGAVRLKIQNQTGKTVSKIEIAVESEFIDLSMMKPSVSTDIVDGEEKVFRLNLIPKRNGELITSIFLTYWITEDQPNVLKGETVLYVRKPSAGPGPIHIDRSVHIEGGESYGLDAAGAVNININGLAGHGEMPVPRNFKEGSWRDLPLKWDPESTKVLRDSLAPVITEPPEPSARIEGSRLTGAWLRLEMPGGRVLRAYLHLKPEISIGSDLDQGIICMMTDAGGEPDQKNQCISRRHLTLKITPHAAMVTDHSSNGTYLDSCRLHNDTIQINNGQIINLAGVFPLKYNEFKDLSPVQAQIRHALLSAGPHRKSAIRVSMFRQEMSSLPLNAVRLRKFGSEGDLEYFIIRKELDIGSARTNPLVLSCDDVSELHARLVVRNNQLHLVDLGSTEGTWLENDRLHPYESRIIANNGILRMGSVTGAIRLIPERVECPVA